MTPGAGGGRKPLGARPEDQGIAGFPSRPALGRSALEALAVAASRLETADGRRLSLPLEKVLQPWVVKQLRTPALLATTNGQASARRPGSHIRSGPEAPPASEIP